MLTLKVNKMKKKICIIVLLFVSFSYSQNLTKEELIDKLSDNACECTNKQEITKDNFELTLGICLLEGINIFEKDVEKHYGIDIVSDDKKMEELGYDIGKKMGLKCPTVFKFMLDYEENNTDADFNELTISGSVVEIKSDQFLSLKVKEDSGKINQFILLGNFDNSFLLTDKVLKVKDLVDVTYYEMELFDAKIAKFISFKIISDIIKK